MGQSTAQPATRGAEPAVYRVQSERIHEIEQEIQQRFRTEPGFSVTIHPDELSNVHRICVLAEEKVLQELPALLRQFGNLLPKESGKTLVLIESQTERPNRLRGGAPMPAPPGRPDPARMTQLPNAQPMPVSQGPPPQALPPQVAYGHPAPGAVQTLPRVETPPNIAFRNAEPIRSTPPVTRENMPVDRDSYSPSNVPLSRIEQTLVSLLAPRISEMAPGKYLLDVRHENVRRHCSIEIDRRQGRLLTSGDRSLCDQLVRLIDAIDRPDPPPGRERRFIPIGNVKPESVARIMEINRSSKRLSNNSFGVPEPYDSESHTPPIQSPKLEYRQNEARHLPLPSKIRENAENHAKTKHLDARRNPVIRLVGYQFEGAAMDVDFGGEAMNQTGSDTTPGMEVVSDFRYQILPDLDVLIIDATGAEVARFKDMIDEIVKLSKIAEPQIEVFFLKHVNCISLNYVIRQVYVELFKTKQGAVTFMPMINPNAMLLVGWGNSMEAMKDLIETLDKPVSAENNLLQVIRLEYASAQTVYTTLRATFPPLAVNAPNAFAPRVQIVVDVRTNSLIVQAGQNDMNDILGLVKKMDVKDGGPKLQIRQFKLKHTLATDTAQVLTDAIASGTAGTADRKLPSLQLYVQTEEGRRMIESGIMSDVRISRDVRSNTVIVTAPEHCMPLIEELIEMIDAPSATAQVKFFQVLYGDANSMVLTLKSLIPAQIEGQVGPQLPGLPGAKDEETLIPIRFAVDTRTNSILAAGSSNDLKIVEALLFHLDREDQQIRKTYNYPLKSMKAEAVSVAINEYVRSKRTIQQAAPGVISPYQQIESEVIVIPEVVGNSLIVSATPRYYDEIIDLIKEIDTMPPQVVIQVLIGEVTLSDTKELGAEFGIQDSLLFNRSTFNSINEGTRKITRTENGVTTVIEEPIILNGTAVPGWLFNENPSSSLANGYNTNSANGAGTVGSQLLTNFATGRVGAETGFGGMVFSANSDAVSIMIRALQETNRLEILSRPQITAMNNQPAFIHVGQLVPRFKGTQMTSYSSSSDVIDKQVGLMLMVTPSISPEGNVVMLVGAEKSKVGREADGVVVAFSEGGEVRSPKIDRIHTMTMISAADNETVVLGGLITKDNQEIKRKVPLLGDIPLVGRLFRYDYTKCTRSELLIILTPRVIRNSDDMEAVKQIEAARMNWCVGGVARLHGDIGVYNNVAEQPYAGDAVVVFPEAVEMEELKPLDEMKSGEDGKTSTGPKLAPSLPADRDQPTGSPKMPTPVLPKK